MPETPTLAKAQLFEVILGDGDQATRRINEAERTVTVQFNPETLKVAYSNTMTGEDQSGGSAAQFVSKSSTKLTVDLWFDVSALADENDVRELTKKVNYFITPQEKDDGLAPPAVCFLWGSFLFEGVMDSMSESLELFSAEGRPLRAKVSVSISSQDIQFKIQALAAGAAADVPGTTPQTQAQSGDSLQQLMGRDGSPSGWQDVAAANGIENPRLLDPGAFLDLGAQVAASVSAGVSVSGGVGISGGAGGSAGADLGFGASAGLVAGGELSAGASLGASGGAGASAEAELTAG